MDRGVDDLAIGGAAHDRDVLADAVEDDDHVVERVAQDGQQRGHRRARHLPPGERVDRERQPHVVEDRDQRRQGELVSKRMRQVDDDHREAEQDRVDRVADDLAPEGGPTESRLELSWSRTSGRGCARVVALSRLERLGVIWKPGPGAVSLGGRLDLGVAVPRRSSTARTPPRVGRAARSCTRCACRSRSRGPG